MFGSSNVRESPIHLQDGELASAQNAELSRDEAAEALVKRLGMTAFTPDALAGEVYGLTSIPLPDLNPTLTRLLVGTALGWRSTTNGTAWATFSGPGLLSTYASSEAPPNAAAQLGGYLYYTLHGVDFPTIQRANSIGIAASGALERRGLIVRSNRGIPQRAARSSSCSR